MHVLPAGWYVIIDVKMYEMAYVCIYIYIYIYYRERGRATKGDSIHAYIHTSIHTYTYIHACIHTYAYIQNLFIRFYVYVCVCVYIHV